MKRRTVHIAFDLVTPNRADSVKIAREVIDYIEGRLEDAGLLDQFLDDEYDYYVDPATFTASSEGDE